MPYAGVEVTLFVAALGAGLSVTPGLFMVALSFERSLVARALALLNLLRLTGGFISAPGVEHTIGSRAGIHVAQALPQFSSANADLAARTYLLTRCTATRRTARRFYSMRRALAFSAASLRVR